jgi:two-component system response regulator YesN
MYKVLVVDDEPLARESLKFLIDWSAYGFEIAAEAEDGKIALALMRQRHFSLVLTDIRMPTMNGLEFIEKLREFSDARVVILSGYEDFEYARHGLKLSVNDYLLKPVDEDDLIGVLLRISEEIAEQQLLQRQHRLGLTVLRDQFLRKLAHGQVNGKEIEDQSRLLNLRSEVGTYSSILVEMDFLSVDNDELTERDIELKRYAVRNVLEELSVNKGYVFEDSEERYGLLLFGDARLWDTRSMLKFAEEIAPAIEVNVKETVSIGLSNRVVSSMMSVDLTFRAAEEALDGKFLRGNNSILSDTKATNASGQRLESAAIQVLQEEVLESIKSYKEDLVKGAICRLWEAFRGGEIIGSQIRVMILELLVQLLQLVKSYGANPEPLFHYEHRDYERVMRTKTIDELYAFMEIKCMGVLQMLVRMRDLQPHTVVGIVKKIIQEQYHTNVSLRSVAQQVYLNPHYLGKVFKAGTDVSFNDYLLQIRIEQAKELLVRTDKKVYEIALAVGYGELDWFYKRFKTYVGISAGEYRSQYRR